MMPNIVTEVILYSLLFVLSYNSVIKESVAIDTQVSNIDTNQNIQQSVDSIFNEYDQYNTDPSFDKDGKSHNIKQGKFYNTAYIIAINSNIGKKSILKVSIDNPMLFGNFKITLATCWQESSLVYAPESEALIEIIDESDQNLKQVFSGWIMSNHRAVSQPYSHNYYFFLSSCNGIG